MNLSRDSHECALLDGTLSVTQATRPSMMVLRPDAHSVPALMARGSRRRFPTGQQDGQ
jgi:hypothetical protein